MAGPPARELAVVYRPVNELLPYARNARTHSEAQVAEIAGSIRAFGFTNPVLVREDATIVAGHGRVLAARVLGMELVPTITLRGLTETQARALTLADNRLALNAGWDAAMLSVELLELRDLGADLQVMGFTPAELAAALEPPTQGLTHPDAVPGIPETPVSRAGDVWKLGRHRLMCGDATVAEDVKALLGGVVPLLMVTDPPYGVDYDATWRRGVGVAAPHAEAPVTGDERSDWTPAWRLFPGDIAYVWHSGLTAGDIQANLLAAGLIVRAQIIWRKHSCVVSRGAYHWQHEPCWYAVRKGRTGNWHGDRKQSTVWDIANAQAFGAAEHDDMRSGHSTQKPVECMRRPMENNSNASQAVYDPFVGSGTTIIAAEQISRICFAMDITPAYVDVAALRWCAFTGQPAFLEKTGETMDAVRERREREPAPPVAAEEAPAP